MQCGRVRSIVRTKVHIDRLGLNSLALEVNVVLELRNLGSFLLLSGYSLSVTMGTVAGSDISSLNIYSAVATYVYVAHFGAAE